MSLNYTEEELNLLANTPFIIGSAMAFAGDSGLIGTGKEMFTNAQAVLSGIKAYPNNNLIQTILPNIQDDSSVAMDKLKKIREWGVKRYKAKGVNSTETFQAEAINDCKTVAALLTERASAIEATEYRQWAISIAEKVAMAATEGSFLGFGGERFSVNEREFFSRIKSAFGLETLLA